MHLSKLLFFFLLTTNLFANEWICKKAASERVEKNIYFVCGVGEAKNLQSARENAMTSAYKEFNGLCKHSYDCNQYQKTITPKRTTCEETQDGHRCFRGFRFFITDKKASEDQRLDQEIAKLQAKQERERQLQIKRRKVLELKRSIANKDFSYINTSSESLLIMSLGAVSSGIEFSGQVDLGNQKVQDTFVEYSDGYNLSAEYQKSVSEHIAFASRLVYLRSDVDEPANFYSDSTEFTIGVGAAFYSGPNMSRWYITPVLNFTTRSTFLQMIDQNITPIESEVLDNLGQDEEFVSLSVALGYRYLMGSRNPKFKNISVGGEIIVNGGPGDTIVDDPVVMNVSLGMHY